MSYLFFTGAGISANAGIKTYRDKDSKWSESDLEEMSHFSKYKEHLGELWDRHWGPVQSAMLKAKPTHAHKAIAEFQQGRDVIIATQNIDNLHERAGSENVAHLHGVIDPICMDCESPNIEVWVAGIPKCLSCGQARTRPNVVLFGELLDERLMNALANYINDSVTHVVSIGSSLNVFPATGLVFDALGKKHVTIINKEPTSLDRFANKVYHEDADLVIDEVLENIKD